MPKGAYDRAASAWQPKPLAEYPPELVARVRQLYQVEGHSMRETAELAGTTIRVLQRLMPRNGITARPAIKRDQRGPLNTSWKGDQARYQAMHLRVEAARGKPSHCSACDSTDPEARYEWANLTGHYEDTHDYVRLCTFCHRRLDARRRTQTGKRTAPGRR